jgi:hypothetical protein
MINQNRSILMKTKIILRDNKNLKILKISIYMSFSLIKEDSHLIIQIFKLKNQKSQEIKDTTKVKPKEHNQGDSQI